VTGSGAVIAGVIVTSVIVAAARTGVLAGAGAVIGSTMILIVLIGRGAGRRTGGWAGLVVLAVVVTGLVLGRGLGGLACVFDLTAGEGVDIGRRRWRCRLAGFLAAAGGGLRIVFGAAAGLGRQGGAADQQL
jgi:hypothetical protein